MRIYANDSGDMICAECYDSILDAHGPDDGPCVRSSFRRLAEKEIGYCDVCGGIIAGPDYDVPPPQDEADERYADLMRAMAESLDRSGDL